MQRHKDSRNWALKAKEEKTSVLKNQSKGEKEILLSIRNRTQDKKLAKFKATIMKDIYLYQQVKEEAKVVLGKRLYKDHLNHKKSGQYDFTKY
ncbi:hypothetical protein RO3G_16916 [Rhizopus delemar RA 99-880]|uniref:Uncharacterized protein n=1 Tax=Rhizopus delemar (strain RA 99-880 / ATCC MYA-4621 / FGSC 9543 / NRRL 43880) TaxID=246409 RepID=I1CUS5_RHIO9|nr:hypothetical protein RO3G_16916 [Rhizopus delemar RA 99-880]|eukprot:EIE92205.1 hypothetical protein RO3G_16916 [Rhizopus delemar RA 99-880]